MRLRWAFLFFAFLATVINYLDRQTLSVIAPVLRNELHFGDIEYSRMVTAFLLAYTIGNAISGATIDRMGTRWGYAVCMLWWSTASVLHAFARSAFSLGACRFLLGIGEAGNWPAAVKMTAEWFPERQRALASGIFNSGSSIGAMIAPPLVAWIVLQFGWPSAFFSIGAIGFLWVVWWLRFYFTPENVKGEALAAPPGTALIFRERFVWTLMIAKMFFDPAWYFYVFWFPQYLSSVHHFDLAKIGFYGWIPFLSADVGNLAGGAFAALLLRRGVSLLTTRRLAFLFFLLLMTAAIPAVLTADARRSIAMVSVATFGYTGCLANMLALPGDFYPKNTLGSIWGLASMGAGFGGMVWTLLTGWMVNRYSYTPVFIGFGLMPLVCAAILVSVTTEPSKNNRLQLGAAAVAID